MKKLLFVCSGNKLRSPTAEIYFAEKGYITKSAGTSTNAKRTINIEDIKWSDAIYVMEEKHKQRIVTKYPRLTKYKNIIVLNIKDDFEFMDVELIKILEKINIT